MVNPALEIVVLLIQLIIGILFAILSVYLSLRFFDRMTEGIDEIKELKKGNKAVAIILLSLIISIGMVVKGGIENFSVFFSGTQSLPFFILAFIMSIVQLVVVLAVAVIAIFASIRILDSITQGIDELKEIKKGNIAVALLVGAVIFVVSSIVSGVIADIANLSIFSPELLASLLGVR